MGTPVGAQGSGQGAGQAAWGWGEGRVMQWAHGTGRGGLGARRVAAAEAAGREQRLRARSCVSGSRICQPCRVWQAPPEGLQSWGPAELEGQGLPGNGPESLQSVNLGPAGERWGVTRRTPLHPQTHLVLPLLPPFKKEQPQRTNLFGDC